MVPYHCGKQPSGVQSGFAFLEVLISIVVIGVGLLAISVLQTNALQSTHQAVMRSIASDYALAFSERVRTGAGDKLYDYNEDNEVYRMNGLVACYLRAASNAAFSDLSAQCPAVPAVVASDVVDMSVWLAGLPQASWRLDVLRAGVAASGAQAMAACDFSLASGSLANQPCALQVTVSWQRPREVSSSTLVYSFR